MDHLAVERRAPPLDAGAFLGVTSLLGRLLFGQGCEAKFCGYSGKGAMPVCLSGELHLLLRRCILVLCQLVVECRKF